MRLPVTIRGVRYPSQLAAAKALGVTNSNISQSLDRNDGNGDRIGLGLVGRPGKSVRIRGVVYPSRGAAAKALGVTHAAISNAIRYDRLESVGLQKRSIAKAGPL